VRDPRYLELAAKVRVVGHPDCDAIFPNQFPAVLAIRTTDGLTHEARVMVNRGGPQNPLSVQELTVKFMSNARRVLDASDARATADAVVNLVERPLKSVLERTTAIGAPALR
jgi:2-methylcitrate dehydratase PrpD